MKPLLTSFTDAQAVLGGVSRTKVYQLVGRGELELVKIDRRSFITTSSLENYVAELVAIRGAGS